MQQQPFRQRSSSENLSMTRPLCSVPNRSYSSCLNLNKPTNNGNEYYILLLIFLWTFFFCVASGGTASVCSSVSCKPTRGSSRLIKDECLFYIFMARARKGERGVVNSGSIIYCTRFFLCLFQRRTWKHFWPLQICLSGHSECWWWRRACVDTVSCY